MSKPCGKLFFVVLLCAVWSASPLIVSAQETVAAAPAVAAKTNANPVNTVAYEVVLHLLAASNDGTKSVVPKNLEPLVRQLRDDFTFTGYQVSTTLLNRVRNNGSIAAKGFARLSNASSATTFYDVNLQRIQAIEEPNQPARIEFAGVQVGLRVPVPTSTASNSTIINYESTGITTQFALNENTPTVVGTLTTSRPDELLFVVLTIRREADNRNLARKR